MSEKKFTFYSPVTDQTKTVTENYRFLQWLLIAEALEFMVGVVVFDNPIAAILLVAFINLGLKFYVINSLQKSTIVMTVILGYIAGFLSFLVANMIGNTSMIIFFALGLIRSPLLLYGLFLATTIALVIFVKRVYFSWNNNKVLRLLFMGAFLSVYFVTFLLYVLGLFL
jgi:hypothetical protein